MNSEFNIYTVNFRIVQHFYNNIKINKNNYN
jgi:hypothetical protein